MVYPKRGVEKTGDPFAGRGPRSRLRRRSFTGRVGDAYPYRSPGAVRGTATGSATGMEICDVRCSSCLLRYSLHLLPGQKPPREQRPRKIEIARRIKKWGKNVGNGVLLLLDALLIPLLKPRKRGNAAVALMNTAETPMSSRDMSSR